MLYIFIHNVSGLDEFANYDYTVRINDRILAKGHLDNFEREKGWKELVRKMLEDAERNEE